MTMIIAYKTDKGKQRRKNEDAILVDQDSGICILADGIGKRRAGEIASELAVKEVHAYLKDRIESIMSSDDICRLLADAITHAHCALRDRAKNDIRLSGMGTTIVLMLIKDKRAYICHAGDSRAYRLRNATEQITVDHTFQNYLDDNIMIRDLFFRKNARILTEALGISEKLSLETNRLRLLKGDVLLLCSDGLTDMLSDDEIRKIVLDHCEAIDTAADALIHAANSKGGKDNISVILMKWSGSKETLK
ncbi:MAG: protein phosphatase 2C domain-containing protein [Thermodesulfovibrionales bacterium]